MYNTPTLSTASCSPQQRLSDVQNMAGISPRKRYGASEKREPVEVSFGVGTRPNNGVTLVEPTAYRRAQQIGARSEASETSQSPQRQWQVEPLTANSTKARPWRQQVQEKPATLGDDSIAATSGSARDSLRGLAAERDRLQRQVQEMRSDVSNTRQDLSSQHARQKVQTEELRGTLQDLQAEAQRLQTEQRRQAAALKGSLKAPDPAANMRLEKQVEGVVSIVKGQEERFERLETDITSAYESQRKQLQQALAENRQLAKGLEEDSMRRQNMMAELMEKVTRNSAVNQLSSELANASTVIQGQTADWSVLSRQIRQEVTGLANEMKADRESRALECASNRVEVVKMVEDARRQGAMEAMGLHDQGGVPDLYLPAGAEAMISRPGILAVHNLVDINCKILRDMEDQLVIRAGFIAGVFHTWRFQANLMKTGRQFEDHFHDIQDQWSAELQAHRRTFEDQLATAAEKAAAHKEHVRQQHDLLLRQWMLGDAKGMYTSIWRAWSGYVIKEKTRLRNAANIKKVCLEWCEGKNLGLKRSVFSSWQQEYSIAHLKRLRDQDLDEAQAEFDAAMKARLDELEHHRHGAKKALEKAVAKWKDGEQKGMVTICFRALKENRATARALKGKHKSVEMALKKFLLGKDRGAKLTLWSSWKQDMLESRLRASAQNKLQDQLDAESARLKAEFEKQMDKHAGKLDAAHKAVELMSRKWLKGDCLGLVDEVYHVWSKYALKRAESEKKLNSVKMSVAKWARGDAKGVLVTVFMGWKQDAKTAAADRRMEEALLNEQAKLEEILAAQRAGYETELAKHRTEAEIAMDKARASVMASVTKWAAGDEKGSKKTVFQNWSQFTKQSKMQKRNREAVNASLRNAFMGKDKAALLNTLKSWVALTRSEKAEREKEDVLARQKAHWEAEQDRMRDLHEKELRGTLDEKDRLKAQAQATTELALKKWMGQTAVNLGEYFIMWHRYCAALKDANRKRTAVKDAMSRFLEGERRGVLHSVYLNWKNYVMNDAKNQAAMAKLQGQVDNLLRKQEKAMQRYAAYLAGSSGPALKGLVFRRWFEVSAGVKMKAEFDREHEVKLEEMKRQHEMNETRKKELRAKSLHNLGMKGDKMILMDVFLAWSLQYQKAKIASTHKMNENKALQKYSQFMLGKKLKQDNKSLLTSTFAEWRREGKVLRHEEALNTLEERDVYIAQLKAGFEEQLALAYSQIDQITETLQKELQTKEQLAQELREAYEKSRKINLPDYPGTPGSATPGSRSRLTRPTSVERPGTAPLTGSATAPSRPARHSMPVEPMAVSQLRTPLGAGLPGPLAGLARGEALTGSASRSSSPRGVNWSSVVERLEDRGLIHDISGSGRRY